MYHDFSYQATLATSLRAAWQLDDLPGGLVIKGPAVLAGRDATALLEPGWTATVHDSGALVARRA